MSNQHFCISHFIGRANFINNILVLKPYFLLKEIHNRIEPIENFEQLNQHQIVGMSLRSMDLLMPCNILLVFNRFSNHDPIKKRKTQVFRRRAQYPNKLPDAYHQEKKGDSHSYPINLGKNIQQKKRFFFDRAPDFDIHICS
ncbi:hypothetical protein D3C71_1092950 [compost metagenome]